MAKSWRRAAAENLIERRLQGFACWASTDSGLFAAHAAPALWAATEMSPTFAPGNHTAHDSVAAPGMLRPDRSAINEPGRIRFVGLAGVSLTASLGNITARDLTTGLVTFEPDAKLEYHTHAVSESITVLAWRSWPWKAASIRWACSTPSSSRAGWRAAWNARRWTRRGERVGSRQM
jgi:hypothetical protein